MTLWIAILLLITIGALIASALFSTAEVAIFSIRPHSLRRLQQLDDVRVRWLQEVLDQPRRYLVTILLGNVTSNALVVCGMTLLRVETGKFQDNLVWGISILLLLLVVGELIPKSIATQKVTAIALGMVGWLRRIEKIVHPITSYLDGLSQQCADFLKPPSMKPLHGLSEDEYLTMLDVGTREGALHPSEKKYIERTLSLADRNLRELMTPRSEMKCIDSDMDFEKMKAHVVSIQHRRIPLYSESLDSIVGVLNARRFLLEPETDFIMCVEPPAFVPETMGALELLKSFLRGQQHMAMVVDEFGGVEGLVTLEDIVEEVFGEIYDEYDDHAPHWVEIEPHVFLARGSAHLPAIAQWLKIDLEADGIDTLGGWITNQIGVLPKVGDHCAFDGFNFQVEKMNRLRVGSVLIKRQRRGI
jgi:putative hemolysin